MAGDGPQLSEFVVSVSAVLETTGVDHAAKSRVMNVVNRLVERLHRAEEEKDTATLQLKGRKESRPLTPRALTSLLHRDGGEGGQAGEGAGGAEPGEGGGQARPAAVRELQ